MGTIPEVQMNNIQAIFLDTNVFERSGFIYTENNIEKLLNLCNKYSIPIFINEIVKREVIQRSKKKADEKLKNINKKELVFINKIYPEIPTNKEEIKEAFSQLFIRNFDVLLRDNLKEIPIENVDIKELTQMYFDIKAPFGNEINKKCEFPDAIIGLSVKQYIEENSVNILLISHDNGIKAFCDEHDISHVTEVSQALNLLNEQFDLNVFFEKYQGLLTEQLVDYIKAEYVEFNVYGYSYEDSIPVDTFKITNIKVKNLYLTKEDDSSKTLDLTLDCIIEYKILTGSYPDYQNAYRDKEDDVWYAFSNLTSTIEDKKEISIDFEVSIVNFDELHSEAPEFEIYNKTNWIDIEFDVYDDSVASISYRDFEEE